MSAQHSPTPWHIDPSRGTCMIRDVEAVIIASTNTSGDVESDDQNAEHIVACVNACAKLPNPRMLPVALETLQQFIADDRPKAGEHELARLVLEQLGIRVRGAARAELDDEGGAK